MATGIPLPGQPGQALLQGINTGSSLISRIMQPIIQREQLAQQQKQHMEDLALRNKQFQHSGMFDDLRRKIMEQQLLRTTHLNDPNYEFNEFNRLFGGENTQSSTPVGRPGEGGGLFNAEELEKPTTKSKSPFDFERLKTDPAMRAWFIHKFKFDPLAMSAQSPAEKQAAQISTFREKEKIKNENRAGQLNNLTAPIKTKYQSVIGGATSALPILKDLIEKVKKGEVPGQLIGSVFKRNAQANYKAEISTLLDGIRNAYTIPNTDSGTTKAEDKVLRKNGESDTNYAARLELIYNQIKDREADARAKLGTGLITTTVPENPVKTKVINGKTFKLINGEWHD